MSFSLTPPARYIDPRGQRFGAGLSAAVLLLAIVNGLPWLAALVGLNLLIAAAFGTRLFLPGRPWPLVKRALLLGPTELEHEYPPRFAQALGGIFIAAGTAAFFFSPTIAWVFVGAVAALQTLLAATNYCLGCRLYFLRWVIPSLFARLFRNNDRNLRLPAPRLRRI